ncbi:MAG: hypothetical protein ABW189_09565 [Rickettsiales bacterium]
MGEPDHLPSVEDVQKIMAAHDADPAKTPSPSLALRWILRL